MDWTTCATDTPPITVESIRRSLKEAGRVWLRVNALVCTDAVFRRLGEAVGPADRFYDDIFGGPRFDGVRVYTAATPEAAKVLATELAIWGHKVALAVDDDSADAPLVVG